MIKKALAIGALALATAGAGKAYSEARNFELESVRKGYEGKKIEYTALNDKKSTVIEKNNADVRFYPLGDYFYDIDNDGLYGKAEHDALMRGEPIFMTSEFDEAVRALKGTSATQNPQEFYAFVNTEIQKIRDASKVKDSQQDASMTNYEKALSEFRTSLTGYSSRLNSLESTVSTQGNAITQLRQSISDVDRKYEDYLRGLPFKVIEDKNGTTYIQTIPETEATTPYTNTTQTQTETPLTEAEKLQALAERDVIPVQTNMTATEPASESDSNVARMITTHDPAYDNAKEVETLYLEGKILVPNEYEAQMDEKALQNERQISEGSHAPTATPDYAARLIEERKNLMIENEMHREAIKNAFDRYQSTQAPVEYKGHPITQIQWKEKKYLPVGLIAEIIKTTGVGGYTRDLEGKLTTENVAPSLGGRVGLVLPTDNPNLAFAITLKGEAKESQLVHSFQEEPGITGMYFAGNMTRSPFAGFTIGSEIQFGKGKFFHLGGSLGMWVYGENAYLGLFNTDGTPVLDPNGNPVENLTKTIGAAFNWDISAGFTASPFRVDIIYSPTGIGIAAGIETLPAPRRK